MKRPVIQVLFILLIFSIAMPAWAQEITSAHDDEALASSYTEDLAYVEDNREAVIYDIVARWRETMDARQGTEGWAEELFAALESAQAEKLLAASQARTYDEVGAALFGRWQGPDAQVLAPGDVPAAFGSTSTDLVFTPLTPCRIIDTRTATGGFAGRIGPNNGKEFQVNLADFSAQGGVSSSCGIPTSLEVSAVVINVASTDQTGSGHIRVIPTGGGLPTAALLNYTMGVNISNAAISASAVAAGDDIFIYSGVSESHVVVDLMGYFAAPNMTLPDNFITSVTTSVPSGDSITYYTPPCPTGYRLVGGGCGKAIFNSTLSFVASRPANGESVSLISGANTGDRWLCMWQNDMLTAQDVSGNAICERIPGR